MDFETPLVFNQPVTYTAEHFDGSHATPLLLLGDEAQPELQEYQDTLEGRFTLTGREILGGIFSDSVVNLTTGSIHSRMKAREALNSQAYVNRLYKKPNYHLAPDLSPAEIHAACNRAKIGHGSIEDNELAGIVYGTESSELSNITVIGDFRADERDEMFTHIEDFIVEGSLPKNLAEYDKIKLLEYDRDISVHQHHLAAVRLGLTHTIGRSKRGSLVKLRTSTIIDTRPSSGFNQETVDKFLAQRLHGPLSRTALKWLIEDEVEADHIRTIASNDTVYRIHPKNE